MIQFEELRLQLLEDEDALKELSSALGLEEIGSPARVPGECKSGEKGDRSPNVGNPSQRRI